jgi:hypothetical protein
MRVKLGFLHLVLFPIKVELKGIRTHVYVRGSMPESDSVTAQGMLLDALRDGHGFISNYRRGDARGSSIFVELPSGELLPPGKTSSPLNAPLTVRVKLTESCIIRLIRNGVPCMTAGGVEAKFAVTSPGLYRIEAVRRQKAWIYSNPIPVGEYPII